ncbi:MAG TPA: HYR domain-containing protein, partial [Bacteroidia bacterium]|nr:HYR domain-containing protein [Bacteroidia bacterium]
MKTYYKLLACLLILGFSMLHLTMVNAQCTNSASFGSAVAPTGAGVVTISTCSFQSEYSTISSVVAGNRYVVTASIAGTYITMHFSTPSGTVVAAGVTPLQFTAPCAGTYYAHWNTNASCGLASSCMTTTIACSSCGAAASQCTNSSAFATVSAPVSGVTTITTCSFQSEYSTINTVASNTVYSTTASLAGTFITVHSGSSAGPVVASGVTPIIWTSTVAGTYYLHWNTNASCGLASSCMTTTIGFVGPNPCGPPPSGCTNGAAFGSGTIPSNNTVITLTTCAFAGEYSTVFGAVAGQTLQFTATASYSPVYLTVHSGTFNGPVVASGNSPLTFANTFTGTLFVHYNTNSSCGTLSVCHTGTVQCTSCPPPAAPNDLCAGAFTIVCPSTTTGNTTGAGTDANACGGAASPGLWYKITPAASTSITLSLCGSAYDTRISVYSGSCAGAMVACNDDATSGPCAFTLQSEVTFAATGGVTYFILVNGFSANFGAFTMSATCAAAFDPCAGIVASNLCGVNNTTVIPSGNGAWTNGPFLPPGKEAVYTFTPVTTGNYTITQTTSTVGTWVDYFFKPQSGGCNSSGWTFIQDLNGNGLTTAGFAMTAGVPYYIYLDPEGTAGGTVNWQVNCSFPAPANDLCTAVVPVPLTIGVPQVFTGNTVGATAAGDGSFTAYPTVWHAITLPACADVILEYCATSPVFGNVWINLATACPAFAFTPAGTFVNCSGNGNFIVTHPNVPAGTYWIPVLGQSSDPGFIVVPGPYSLTVNTVACPPPATNDDCSGAIPITCGSITTGNTTGSNPDVTPCGTFAHGLWYSITLPTSGTITLATCGSTYDTWLSIYSGSTCGALGTCVASNDDAAAGPCAFTLQSYITTAPMPAGTYYILVAGFSTNMGSFSLNATCALCAVPPVGGTVTGPASGCTGSMVTFNVSGSSSTQWQVSNISATGPFTDIAGETAPTLNYIPSSPGTYYFQNSASGPGCTPSFSNVVTTTILSSGGILTTTATPSASACPGTTINLNGNFATGAATLTITISAPGFEDEVEWTVNPGGFSGGPYGFGTTNTVTIAPSSYPVTFSINSQGTFNDNTPTYTVTCNATSTVLVTGSLAGGQTFTSGPLSCLGSSGVLTSPSWSGPGGFSANTLVASLPVTSTSGGVYTLTGISPTGCQVSSSVTVTTLASPVPSASSNAPVCDGSNLSFFGDNLAIGQSSGNTYSWSGPNGYSASGQFPTLSGASLLASGTYTVTVTNSLGCTESSTTSVSINPNPILSVASVTNASCIGSSDGCIDIDATNGAPLYLFDLGGNSTLDGIYCGLGAGTYTVTVIDDNGCESLTNASVIEEDLVDPVIICTPDVTVNNTPNLCSGVATWVGPVGTDNCAGATTSQTGGPVSGSTFPVGITPITYTVTDAFLNTATCTFNVIVVDNQNPSITCPPDVIVNNDPGFCYATAAALGNPTTGDNCAVLGVSNNAPAQFPVGATIVDWEVEDLSGNKAQCQQFVIVQDNENPVISGMPSNITFTASPADCFPSISWTAPTAADNCS